MLGRLVILFLWLGGFSWLAGCAPALMNEGAPHDPPLKRVHQGDAAALETESSLITITSFLSLGDKKDLEVAQWLRATLGEEDSPIRWVFKHRASRGNKAGNRIARTSLAAQEQGLFWEFIHAVMDSNKGSVSANIPDSTLYDLANELEMDMKRFERVRGEDTTKARLDADSGLALKLELPPAPSVLVNGRMVIPLEETRLKAMVVEEQRKSERLLSLGVPQMFVSALLTDLNRSETRKITRVQAQSKKEEGTSSFPVGYSNAHLAMGAPEKEALVTLVVFHDFQCSFCKKHAGTLASLMKTFSKELRVIIRHNPLKRHTHARQAAAASLAAVEMGAGEAYHRALMAQPKELHMGGLVQLAAEMELDPLLFEEAMKRHSSLVEMDVRDAEIAGAKGTPHTFVNGRKIRGALNRSIFLRTIRKELQRAKAARVKTGLTGRPLYDHLVGTSAP